MLLAPAPSRGVALFCRRCDHDRLGGAWSRSLPARDRMLSGISLGCEGIVSKQLGSPYRSGHSAHRVKVKNPKAPAVTREAEEDWSQGPRHKAFLTPFLESRHGTPVHKIRRKDRLCGGFITRHCYVHDGQWRSDISIQHFRFTDHSWSYVSNGPVCSKSNTIHGLPFRNSRLGLGRCNGRSRRKNKVVLSVKLQNGIVCEFGLEPSVANRLREDMERAAKTLQDRPSQYQRQAQTAR